MPNPQSEFSASEILAQLDACAKEYNFPVLDNGHIYPVTSRISIFGDMQRWVIVVEVVGYHYRFHGHNGVENCLYIYGNCFRFKPGINNDNVLFVTADSNEGPAFTEERDVWGLLNQDVHTLLIRDQQVNIPKDPAFYASRDVVLEHPPVVSIYEFMRAHLPEYRNVLLAEDDEIYDCFRQNLPKLMQLDEWFHPDIANDEKPSENETFRLIANVLVSGNSDCYQPTKSPNNHWRNWPDGGRF